MESVLVSCNILIYIYVKCKIISFTDYKFYRIPAHDSLVRKGLLFFFFGCHTFKVHDFYDFFCCCCNFCLVTLISIRGRRHLNGLWVHTCIYKASHRDNKSHSKWCCQKVKTASGLSSPHNSNPIIYSSVGGIRFWPRFENREIL